jgi:hypothetical protein
MKPAVMKIAAPPIDISFRVRAIMQNSVRANAAQSHDCWVRPRG